MIVNDSITAWVDEQRARLRAIRDEADADLAALDRVAGMLKQSPRERSPRQPLTVSAAEIAGMSVLEAALFIAEKNEGVLASTPARELMVAAGVLEDTRSSSTVLYAALNDSGRFEKGNKRGEYRIVVNPFADIEWTPSDEDDEPDKSWGQDDVITRMPARLAQ